MHSSQLQELEFGKPHTITNNVQQVLIQKKVWIVKVVSRLTEKKVWEAVLAELNLELSMLSSSPRCCWNTSLAQLHVHTTCGKHPKHNWLGPLVHHKVKDINFSYSFIIYIRDWIVMSIPVRPTPALQCSMSTKTDEN